jgi:cytochrome c-type biogenesis protein CcmE
MTRKKRRLMVLVLCLLGLGTATGLALTAFQDNLLFFYSPTDLVERETPDRRFRLGGLVEEGSVERLSDGVTVRFVVTDTAHRVPVSYSGILPDLFREGQGVVAQGRLTADGVFVADEVLAKHDENYHPPEVDDALKSAEDFRARAAGTLETGQ